MSRNFFDLVGQFENQKLMSSSYQLMLLDNFSGISEEAEKFQEDWRTYNENIQLLEKFEREKADLAAKEDYIRYQIGEIEAIDPSVEDEQDLLSQKDLCIKKQNLGQDIARINDCLSESDFSILSQLKVVDNLLGQSALSDIINLEEFTRAKEALEDISFKISAVEFEEGETELEQVLERLDQYQKLKRKHSKETSEIVDVLQSLQKELLNINEIDQKVAELKKSIEEDKTSLTKRAKSLHKKRDKQSARLSNCLLYTSPSPTRLMATSRMPSSA
jgi:DNA repair protein RecN (Recombination protein N)